MERKCVNLFFRLKMMHKYVKEYIDETTSASTNKLAVAACKPLLSNRFSHLKMMLLADVCTYMRAIVFSSKNDTHSMTVPRVKGRLDAGYLMGACFTSSMHSEKQHVFLQASCKQKILTYPSICRQMTWTDRAGAQFFFRLKMMHTYVPSPQACRSTGAAHRHNPT
jgi:hypothetical protein